MAKGWKILRVEQLGVERLELAPMDNEWGTKVIEVEIPRTGKCWGWGWVWVRFRVWVWVWVWVRFRVWNWDRRQWTWSGGAK